MLQKYLQPQLLEAEMASKRKCTLDPRKSIGRKQAHQATELEMWAIFYRIGGIT